MERLEQPLLRLAIEIDQHVAADDEIERSRAAPVRLSRSRRSKRTMIANGRRHRERRRRGEVSRAQLIRRIGEIAFVELAALGRDETLAIDVCPEDVDARRAARACPFVAAYR